MFLVSGLSFFPNAFTCGDGAWGYQRTTVNLDLVVQLLPQNLLTTLEALRFLGYQPRIPVSAEQFAVLNMQPSRPVAAVMCYFARLRLPTLGYTFVFPLNYALSRGCSGF